MTYGGTDVLRSAFKRRSSPQSKPYPCCCSFAKSLSVLCNSNCRYGATGISGAIRRFQAGEELMRVSKKILVAPAALGVALLLVLTAGAAAQDPPSPRDRGGQRQSTQRSATDQLDGTEVNRARVDGAEFTGLRPKAAPQAPRRPRAQRWPERSSRPATVRQSATGPRRSARP